MVLGLGSRCGGGSFLKSSSQSSSYKGGNTPCSSLRGFNNKNYFMAKIFEHYREFDYQEDYERIIEQRKKYREEMEADRLGIKKIKPQKICKPQPRSQK